MRSYMRIAYEKIVNYGSLRTTLRTATNYLATPPSDKVYNNYIVDDSVVYGKHTFVSLPLYRARKCERHGLEA